MIGSVIGNYRIDELLGEGGMGTVYRGIDLMLEREVAVKVLRPELAKQPELFERFRAEAITLAKLNHSNIATLYSFFKHDEDHFMVMEFVQGETIDKILRHSGVMTYTKAVPLFLQALTGLEAAHKMDIVHRDIKPANLMLTADGTVKVMDFGIARVLGTSRMTRQGYAIGTLQYMSPEQIRGLDTDARSDIYSLGILLYEMLTGRVPFSSESEYDLMRSQIEEPPPLPSMAMPNIPTQIERIILRALAKTPAERYQTTSEFRRTLEQVFRALTGMSAATTKETTLPLPKTPPQPHAAPTDPMSEAGQTSAAAADETGAESLKYKTRSMEVNSPQVGASLDYASQAVSPSTQPHHRSSADTNIPKTLMTPAPQPSSLPTALYQPQAAAPQKSNAKIFVGVAAILVLAVGAGIGYIALSEHKTQPANMQTNAPPAFSNSEAAPPAAAPTPPTAAAPSPEAPPELPSATAKIPPVSRPASPKSNEPDPMAEVAKALAEVERALAQSGINLSPADRAKLRQTRNQLRREMAERARRRAAAERALDKQ